MKSDGDIAEAKKSKELFFVFQNFDSTLTIGGQTSKRVAREPSQLDLSILCSASLRP